MIKYHTWVTSEDRSFSIPVLSKLFAFDNSIDANIGKDTLYYYVYGHSNISNEFFCFRSPYGGRPNLLLSMDKWTLCEPPKRMFVPPPVWADEEWQEMGTFPYNESVKRLWESTGTFQFKAESIQLLTLRLLEGKNSTARDPKSGQYMAEPLGSDNVIVKKFLANQLSLTLQEIRKWIPKEQHNLI